MGGNPLFLVFMGEGCVCAKQARRACEPWEAHTKCPHNSWERGVGTECPHKIERRHRRNKRHPRLSHSQYKCPLTTT